MKHIAYLIPTIDRIGGAERQAIELAVGMAARGWRVSVVALSGNGGAEAEKLKSRGCGYLSLEMRKGLADPRGWFRLYRWIRREQPSVVHAHLPHAALMARWSRIAAPVCAVVDTIHSPATGGPVRKIGYRASAWLPDKTTAVSRPAADSWLAAGLVSEMKLNVIPNGVEVWRWRRNDVTRCAMRRELGFGDAFVWLAAGRLENVKDHATLLRAMAQMPPRALLIIAGVGPLEARLRSLSVELGIVERVHLVGFEPDLSRWMNAADGFVQCSRWEGLPMALLEACASELPVVATDIAVTREVLPNPVGGQAVAVGDASALAEAMRTVMGLSEAKRRELGWLNRQSAAARFELDTVLKKWEELYCRLLAEHPHPARLARAGVAGGRILQLQ